VKAAERQAHRDCMRRWAEAETVADLGELGALWLEGEIPSQPGYAEMRGPDEETGPLVPVLARLNRARFFTCGSQPGITPDSRCENDHWQSAAVDGFVDDLTVLSRINSACTAGGLHCIVHSRATRWRNDYRSAVPVTRFGGQDCTWFGARLSRRYLRFLYGETGALDVLREAWQVTVIDLEWGRGDRLWPALDEALR
jgi:hypothetical protein